MKKIARKIVFSSLSLLSLSFLIAGDVVFSKYRADAIGLLCPPIIDEEYSQVSASKGRDLAEKIEEEGIVLVKNDGLLPLSTKKHEAVNLFGFGTVQWIYGGSGSGRVLPQSDNFDDNTDFAFAMDDYGIDINYDLIDYYRDYATITHDINTLNFNVDESPYSFGLKEPDIHQADYASLLEDSISFSDTAIVTISRQGGESEDMPTVQYKSKPIETIDNSRHSLEISTEEEDLLNFAQDHFDNVIVIINSTNSFQLDFLARMDRIDACLLVGATGEHGANAIPKVLYGENTPSGHLADTLPYDFKENLNYEYTGFEGVSFYSDQDLEYGINQKTNAGVTTRPSLPYIDYVEGIYVGYRFFETADAEGAFTTRTREIYDNNNEKKTVTGYDAVVQYPFGYGMSYTDFSWELVNISLPQDSVIHEDTEITFEVKVTNTGSYAGKDVVSLYLTPEYIPGEVEKSQMKLISFEKTGLIAPDQYEVVTLKAKARDFASYDCYDLNHNGKTTYEIDEGEYQLKLCENSHTVKEVSSKGGVHPGIFSYRCESDIILEKEEKTGTTIDNLFTGKDAIDGVSVDGKEGENASIPYVKRTDFRDYQGPIKQTSTHDQNTGRKMGEETKKHILFASKTSQDSRKADAFDQASVDAFGNPTHQEPVTFSKPGDLKIYDGNTKELSETGKTLAKNYDDPLWDSLLDQVSLTEAKNMINNAHPRVSGIPSIGLPTLNNYDGPAQIGSFTSKTLRGTGFPCNTVLAQTWNKTLAYEQGLSMGSNMESHGLSGYYGTAINMHRSPFAGRNYEYFSEDPVLTGDLATMCVKAVRDSGKISFVKHFAVAETETSRDSLYTWLTEQTLREIYLEPFRRVVIDGNANGMMTSYNRVGALWAGGSQALMNGILRKEWGFDGAVITDYSDNNCYMNMDETLRAGGDLGMAVSLKLPINSSSSNRLLYQVREAVHHVAFAFVDSKLALVKFNENPYGGQVITSANTKNSFDWVTPVIIDINIAFSVFTLCSLYFGVLDGIGLNISLRKKED